MKKREMIKDKDYFSFIIKNGKFNKDKNYVIYYVDNKTNTTSFGIAIKKSIGNAVLRNRLKRQTRSIIDNNKKLFQLSKDYIIMIRDGCSIAKYDDMQSSIIKLMKG